MESHNESGGVGAAVKECCKCGMDVTGRLRTKDSCGNYYCAPCFCMTKEQELKNLLAAQMPEPDLWLKIPREPYPVYT